MSKQSILSVIFLLLCTFPGYAEEEDPCRGDQMLLSLINRPSISDSPCTVPPKEVLVEAGLQRQDILGGGNALSGPALALRLGVSNNSEFMLNPPNYIYQSIYPNSGFTAGSLSFKHRFFYNQSWIISGDAYIAPPSGSAAFGSPHVQATVNGIFYHIINEAFSCQLQVGVSQFSDSKVAGAEEYQSVNPDFLISYTLKKNIALYSEFYGQTKSSYSQSFGSVAGLGLIYLYNKKTTFDVSFYHEIQGGLYGLGDFVGVGVTRLFGS